MNSLNLYEEKEPIQLTLLNEAATPESIFNFESWNAFGVKQDAEDILKELVSVEEKIQQLKNLYNVKESLMLKLKDIIGVNTEISYNGLTFKVVDSFADKAVVFKTVPVRRFELIIKKEAED